MPKFYHGKTSEFVYRAYASELWRRILFFVPYFVGHKIQINLCITPISEINKYENGVIEVYPPQWVNYDIFQKDGAHASTTLFSIPNWDINKTIKCKQFLMSQQLFREISYIKCSLYLQNATGQIVSRAVPLVDFSVKTPFDFLMPIIIPLITAIIGYLIRGFYQ
jgi:hypothetical protein